MRLMESRLQTRHKTFNPVFAFIISILIWFSVIFFTILFTLVGLIFMVPLSLLLRERTELYVHKVSQLWGKVLLKTAFVWKLHVSGKENIDPKECYVIVANHQSLADILAVLAGVPLHFKFMAKKELFTIAFIGWHMSNAKYIPLERGSKESARRAVGQAREWIRKGVSVLLFPEGTRSPDGAMQAFKSGAFKIASEEGVKILPVAIDGTGQAIPKHEWVLRRVVDLHVRILKPLVPAGSAPQAVDELKEQAHAMISAELDHIRSGK